MGNTRFLSELCSNAGQGHELLGARRICTTYIAKQTSTSNLTVMVIKSPYNLKIPSMDILTYLFGSEIPSDKPVWIDAVSPSKSLSPRTLLQWVKRLAVGLDGLSVKPGEVVLIFSPNHIFVPVAYLGTVGSGRVFSGANPGYGADGMF